MHVHTYTQEAVEWTRKQAQRMKRNSSEMRPQEGEKWRVKIMWNWYFIVWITLHRVQIASQAFVKYFRPKILDLCYGFFSLFNNLTFFFSLSLGTHTHNSSHLSLSLSFISLFPLPSHYLSCNAHSPLLGVFLYVCVRLHFFLFLFFQVDPITT